MKTIRILLVLSLFAQPAAAAGGRAAAIASGPAAGAPALGLPPSSMTDPSAAAQPSAGMELAVPTAPLAADPVAEITGALTRSHPDLGPIRRVWFVFVYEKGTGKVGAPLE